MILNHKQAYALYVIIHSFKHINKYKFNHS